MLIWDMAKNPAPPRSASAVKRSRGRPPKPGGRLSQVEVQRAYRVRLAAAGKVVRIVDAATLGLASIPDAEFEALRKRLYDALLKLELRQQEVARLEQRNAYLEGELTLQGQHHTNALKEIVTLKQQLLQQTDKRRHRPSKK
jgi:hypothetical protein